MLKIESKKIILFVLIGLKIFGIFIFMLAYRQIDFSINVILFEIYKNNPNFYWSLCDNAVFNDKCFTAIELYEIGLRFFIVGFFIFVLFGLCSLFYIIFKL